MRGPPEGTRASFMAARVSSRLRCATQSPMICSPQLGHPKGRYTVRALEAQPDSLSHAMGAMQAAKLAEDTRRELEAFFGTHCCAWDAA